MRPSPTKVLQAFVSPTSTPGTYAAEWIADLISPDLGYHVRSLSLLRPLERRPNNFYPSRNHVRGKAGIEPDYSRLENIRLTCCVDATSEWKKILCGAVHLKVLRIHKLSGFDITVPYWFRVYRHSFVPNAELLQNIRSNLPTLRSLRVHVCHEAIDHQQLYNTEISRPGLYRGDAQLTILKHEIPMQLERKGRKAIVNRLTEENRSSTTTHRILALISYV
jgi:hypothetical protein